MIQIGRLVKTHKAAPEAPSWLWASVVELIGLLPRSHLPTMGAPDHARQIHRLLPAQSIDLAPEISRTDCSIPNGGQPLSSASSRLQGE
jgi:hypothetical protein